MGRHQNTLLFFLSIQYNKLIKKVRTANVMKKILNFKGLRVEHAYIYDIHLKIGKLDRDFKKRF